MNTYRIHGYGTNTASKPMYMYLIAEIKSFKCFTCTYVNNNLRNTCKPQPFSYLFFILLVVHQVHTIAVNKKENYKITIFYT